MAQWLGQFTGLTHATKVEDAEATLRTAVTAFRSAAPEVAPKKAKAVRRLAAKLLTVRLKAIKARGAAATPATGSNSLAEQLREQEEAVRAAGLGGILTEFGASDARG